MKKIITLCLFVFALFLGSQTMVAQNSKLTNKIEVNNIASEKTEALRKFIKFNESQRDGVYQALREYTQATISAEKIETTSQDEIKKIELRLESKMKDILTEDQYKKYLQFPQE